MEFNFTKEYNHGHRVYNLGRISLNRWAPNGLSIYRLVVFGVFAIGSILVLFFGVITGNQGIITFYLKHWIHLIILLFLLVWTLFSMNWDQKNIFQFLLGRGLFYTSKGNQYEHSHAVIYEENQTFMYRKMRRGKRRAKYKA
ncbi:TcpE family conjugal transfer membrane protein [Enterococcus termitis]|uniref:Uncharacterized protein n=1 Tax=Enterococcus termitis TaxID=332950 RepID=A0A1E5GJF2_9ENTE|nr:TcpE family conjugal transfer membrane protein [Enterococcus termitis]OEG12846.1 hypothetical protein BCR25_04955 [Enterococcus termitis]OJG96503.1 hypothetical protein RV18_GL002451 [Enterococcus termitis]